LLVCCKEKHAVVWCYHQQHKFQDSILATVVGQKTQQRHRSKQSGKFVYSY